MTITKDIAAKFAVAIVAVSMVLSAFAPVAKAQTTEDLQKMINDLLAQVAALQSQAGQGGSSTAAGVCPYTWTRDLAVGATGADVMKLQQFLNADVDTRVAASGAGSVGMETEYFGPATAAAVSKMQVKYRADILSPSNLVNPTGYFGASSRAKANSLCVTAPVVTPGDEDATDEDEDEDNGSTTLGGEADLTNFETEDADDTDVEEGDKDVEIGMITVEFENGDAEISRLDITLNGGGTNRPWKAFDTVSLWVDGDMIAEVDAGSKDDYIGTESDGKLRFSGLDLVAMEDEEVEIVVAATIKDNLDGTELGGWVLEAPALRYFDADGVATTDIDMATGQADFNIEVAGEGEELKFSLASGNPDASDIIVDETSTTKDVTVLEYRIKAEENDIELTTLAVKLTTNDIIGDVVSDIRLVVDGQSFNDESGTVTTGTTATYTFDIDGDVVIDADEEVVVEVVVDLKRQGDPVAYPNGTTIKAEAVVASTVAEGKDDLESGQLKGSAVGKEHNLVGAGLTLEVNSTDAKATINNTTADDSFGEFKINFDVTAIEETAFVALTAARATGTQAAIYVIEDANGVVVTTGTVTESLSRKSGGTVSGGYVEIADGETATFELVATFNPVAAGQYRVQLLNVGFAATAVPASVSDRATALPVDEFETSSTLITS